MRLSKDKTKNERLEKNPCIILDTYQQWHESKYMWKIQTLCDKRKVENWIEITLYFQPFFVSLRKILSEILT